MRARILVVAAEMGWLGKGMLGMAMLARPEMDMVNDSVYVGRERPGVYGKWKRLLQSCRRAISGSSSNG